MYWLPLPLRIAVLIGFLALDVFLMRSYVAANNQFPFHFRGSTIKHVVQTGTLPSPSPLPPEYMVEITESDWQGSTLVGKITNGNSYPIFNTEVKVSMSKSKDPWEEHKSHTFSVPSVIEPGKDLFFLKKLAIETGEFWWSAQVNRTQEHAGEDAPEPAKDLKISDKQFPTQTHSVQSTMRPAESSEPWGVAKQIDDVTWTIRVGEDDRMATPQETLQALNEYRQRHEADPLSWDDNLASYAKERALHLKSIQTTDRHEGFKQYVENEENRKKLGFWSVGENAGYGYKLIGVHQIEWIYAADEGHNKNQLSSQWSHVGIGIEGLAVVFIFGGSKM